MSKGTKKPAAKPPTIISLTLPDEGSVPRTGTLLIQRGTLASMRQFAYSDLTGIVNAMQSAATQLMELEKSSLPAFNTTSASAASTTNTPPDAEDEPDPEFDIDGDLIDSEDVEAAVDTPAAVPEKPVTLSLF